jgi:hypothetical protein
MTVHMILNTVIGGGNHNEAFGAAIGATQSFQISAPGRVLAAWYVPVDNITTLAHFDQIRVDPNGQAVTLTIKPNTDALLRIFIYADIG